MPIIAGLVIISIFIISLPIAILEAIVENFWFLGLIGLSIACGYIGDYFSEKDDTFSTIMCWICVIGVIVPILFILAVFIFGDGI